MTIGLRKMTRMSSHTVFSLLPLFSFFIYLIVLVLCSTEEPDL
jgi:hypothetical protein